MKRLFALAIPVSIGQAGNIVANMTDTAMLGKFDSDHMIASTIGFQIFVVPLVLVMGISIALTARTAEALGKGKQQDNLFTALVAYLVVGLFVFGGLYALSMDLHWFHPDPVIADLAEPYLRIVSFSILPIVIFMTFKQYFEAFELSLLTTVVSLASNGLNIVLNYGMIFGNWGFEAMGITGAAYATLASRIAAVPMFLLVIYWVPKYRQKLAGQTLLLDFQKAKKLLVLGLPIGLQFLIEVLAFVVAGLLTGWLGKDQQGAHQIALQLAAFTYLFVTGFGSAATVLAGQFFGERNRKELTKLIQYVLVLVIVYEMITAALFWIFSDQLPYLFLTHQDAAMVAMAIVLVKFAAVFQIPDGIQNVLQGILRGVQDVRFPTWITILSHWLVTLGGGYLLAFGLGFEVQGVWYGFLIGLTVISILLYIRLRVMLKTLWKKWD